MSKTKKIKRLERRVKSLKSNLDFANSEFCQRINRPVRFQRTPVPEVFSPHYNQERQLNTLINYLYKSMDDAYNMAYEMDSSVDELEFVLYIDHHSLRKLMNISQYDGFEMTQGGIKFRGHKVIEVSSNGEHINFVRVK